MTLVQFNNQSTNDFMEQYDEVRKLSRWLLYYRMFIRLCIFQNNYKLITVDLSKKKKALDADPRAIQQTVFQGIAVQKLRLYTIFYKLKKLS